MAEKKAPPGGEKETKKPAAAKKSAAAKKPAAGNKAAAPGKPAGRASSVPLYAFRIELKSIKPKIWRDFFAPSDISLEVFHALILRAMGWGGGHLFSFTVRGEEHINSEEDDKRQFMDAKARPTRLSRIKLNSLGLAKGLVFKFDYDFGDDWEHSIKVLDTDYQPKDKSLRCGCYGGARNCPPEDCGGVLGYNKLLEMLADPDLEEHEENGEYDDWEDLLEWVGSYDPEEFDPDFRTSRMQTVI